MYIYYMVQTQSPLKDYNGFKLFCMKLPCPLLKSVLLLETCAT